jgi:tetratricopeptide (TPR) repeat protein
MVDCLLARLYLLEGRVAEAQTAFEQSPMFKDPGLLKRQYMLVHIFFTLVQTELNLANGSYAQALAVTEAIIPYMQQTGVRLFFADMLYLQGRALLATNRIEAAQSVFETTRAVAEALGARRNLWPTLAELAELAARRGDQAEAQALWQRAAAIVGYIAEHIGSAELAKSFVSQPAVRAVLEQAGATPSRAP